MTNFLFPRILENFYSINIIPSPKVHGLSIVFFWGAVFALFSFLIFILWKKNKIKGSLNEKILWLGLFFWFFPAIIFLSNNLKNLSLSSLYLENSSDNRKTLELCRLEGKPDDYCLAFPFLDYAKTIIPEGSTVFIPDEPSPVAVNVLRYYSYPYFNSANSLENADYLIFYYPDGFGFNGQRLYKKNPVGGWSLIGDYSLAGIIDRNKFILKKEK